MQPPLPEVPKTTSKSIGKEPFPALNVVFGVNVSITILSMVLGCFFPAPDPKVSILAAQLVCAVASVVSFLIDFHLWRGYNWARWLTIVSGVIALFLLFSPSEFQSTLPQIEQILNLVSNIWWFGLSIWLLHPNIAKHFKSA